ncbi:MAG: hypothetical protein KJ989_12905 [Gammaproteobacteria bacterium]|uniref:Putative tail fiber protein n=1 Tax=viral metagenome TaxID=1070528 RepID=A0A6H1ZWY3_9ZZZZ|nr:hypothetical protein [Gammaproteobacteria bacterium]MBU2157114.1 hypothetical protein [Gammaproteobacteria bacterium]MBU2256028.1 hypothetical protein [Gammaproteobacteria bacterium]MBU2295096.1 hypothetical protein [Gammaproteobacteria bacterium]
MTYRTEIDVGTGRVIQVEQKVYGGGPGVTIALDLGSPVPDGFIECGLPLNRGDIWDGLRWTADPVDVQAALTIALNSHLDSVAGQCRYDSRFTCALRAGFPGPFQAEGMAFAKFMDDCNMVGYTIMQQVKAGLRPVPTEAELIAEMPMIEWPLSPIPEGAA